MISSTATNRIKYVHNHTQQLYANLVPATISVNIWGRGTGKTWGVTARKAYYNAVLMPRSVGAIGCPSFTHMMDHIYGELTKSWEDMGLVEGKDFVAFQKPPATWKQPYRKIAKNQYNRCIFFRNGSVIKLFSYNFNSLANGDSIDWLIIEEARLCKKNKIDESIKCLRGNEEHFGHLSIHGSVTYVSDMPRNPNEFWLLDFRAQENKIKISQVLEYAYILSELQQHGQKTTSDKKKERLKKDIKLVSDEINSLCMGLTCVSLASSLDNIHALGPNKLKNWKNTSTEYDWNVSVMNEIQKQVTNSFYPYLDESKHGYYTPRSRFKNVDYTNKVRDCRWDGDIDYTQPLIIGMDYNSDITCLSVYQLHNRTITLLKVFYVLHPYKREDVVKQFKDYYQYLPIKEVVYCYDNTAIATDADKTETDTYAYKTNTELAETFKVTPLYLKQTTHEYRYDLWQGVLKGEHPELPNVNFTYNMDNATKWYKACTNTQTYIRTIKGKSTFGKDKTGERKRLIPADELPHLTEAGDTGLLGVISYYNLNNTKTINLSNLGL
jgi:hypothetical protein